MTSEPTEVPQAVDSRHHKLMVAIDRYYRSKNSLPAPDMGRTAKEVQRLLEANRLWEFDTFEQCLVNRARSENINHAEPAWMWVKTLTRYARGPLDKFGKPKAYKRTWDNDPGCPDYWARRNNG